MLALPAVGLRRVRYNSLKTHGTMELPRVILFMIQDDDS